MSITVANDNVYLNVVMNGPTSNYPPVLGGPVSGEQPIVAEYAQNKTTPFLSKASDYYASVVRFTIPLNKVPIFIMPIVPNTSTLLNPAGFPDQSTLVLGITYLDVPYNAYVQYIPDKTNIPPPVQNQPTQVITPYYYVYSYGSLIRSLNFTMDILWIASGLFNAFPAASPPYFYYDPTSELISLIVPQIFTINAAQIFINESALRFLDGFEFIFNGFNRPAGDDYQFVFQTETEFFYPPWNGSIPIVPSNYFKFTQEYNVLYYWASLRKILVLSNNLPILSEIVPNNSNSGISVALPVITDFVPQISTAGDVRSIAIYNPTGQYRLVDLSGDIPLSNIDIKILWQDYTGGLYPVTISQGQQIELKIAFLKKSLYKKNMQVER
jgi:hypothetical protein